MASSTFIPTDGRTFINNCIAYINTNKDIIGINFSSEDDLGYIQPSLLGKIDTKYSFKTTSSKMSSDLHLQNETIILCHLQSKEKCPYIIQLYGITDLYALDTVYPSLVFPYFDKSFYRIISKSGRQFAAKKSLCLTPFDAWTLLQQIAEGMKFMHNHKVIHRNLCLENIFLKSLPNGKFQAIIHNFENAIFLNKHLPSDMCSGSSKGFHGSLKGFHGSPELLRDPLGGASKSSDVWALGVMIWQIFSNGKLPYEKITSNQDLYIYLMQGNRLPVTQNDWPICVQHFLQRCWSENCKNRPKSREIPNMLQNMEEDIRVYSDKIIAFTQSTPPQPEGPPASVNNSSSRCSVV